MGLGREEELELRGPPLFRPGAKVVSTKQIRNDGTVAGRDIGEIIVRKGDVGYVRDIGTFLQRHYVYAVEFVGRRSVVGMRGRELRPAEQGGAAR